MNRWNEAFGLRTMGAQKGSEREGKDAYLEPWTDFRWRRCRDFPTERNTRRDVAQGVTKSAVAGGFLSGSQNDVVGSGTHDSGSAQGTCPLSEFGVTRCRNGDRGKTLKGNKAQGRIGRHVTGNGGLSQRTRRWSKAL